MVRLCSMRSGFHGMRNWCACEESCVEILGAGKSQGTGQKGRMHRTGTYGHRWTFLARSLAPLPLAPIQSVNSVLCVVSSGSVAWGSNKSKPGVKTSG